MLVSLLVSVSHYKMIMLMGWLGGEWFIFSCTLFLSSLKMWTELGVSGIGFVFAP